MENKLKKSLKVILLILGVVLVVLGLISFRWVTINPNKAESVLAAIDQRGAHWILVDSDENHEDWEIMMSNIALGEDDWLEVYKKLAPSSDTHTAEDLSEALSKAILTNAKRVLEILNESTYSVNLPMVCGAIDYQKKSSYEDKIKFLKEQREAINNVNESNLVLTKENCLKCIDDGLYSISRK